MMVKSMMIHKAGSTLEYLFISLLLVILSIKNEKWISVALSPTTPTRGRISGEERTRGSFSGLSLSSSTKDDYSTSDDRRNESLEQGNHPLWSLNLNLDSLAQAKAGSRAQELLRRIHALYNEGYYEVSPDIVSYNSVLKAWKEDDDPEAALDLLETMIRNEKDSEEEVEDNLLGPTSYYNTDQNSRKNSIRVDVISFNTVIAAFANQGNYHKALELLRKMQKTPIKSDAGDDNADDYFYPDPDTITYNIVLYALAQSKDIGTAAQAENLLREMMIRKEGMGTSVVDTMGFNTVLYAWSREGEKVSNPTETNDAIAKQTMRKRPVSAKTAAQRAEDLLTIMEELSEAGNLNVCPDVYSYTTTIQCWAKCSDTTTRNKESFADKSQAIFNRMIKRGIEPNKLTYTALMNALSKAGEPEVAESVLRKMIDSQLQPDTVSFSSIIDGWARISSERPEAASRALEILEIMKENTQQGMGPSATTYTSVLTALAKSGLRDANDQALALLQDMEEDYAAIASADSLDEDDRWSIRPTNIHYNCVLDAYARSSRSDKAIKAQQLMTVMENHSRLDCRPDTISYNSLMMACAHATGNKRTKERSFEIALRTFKILLSHSGGMKQIEELLEQKPVHELYPTSTTFAHFFRACRKLLHPSNTRRQSILRKSLPICRKLGMLNFLVVHQVQLACQSEAAWVETAGELSEYVGWQQDFKRCSKNVPAEWTCKARK